MVSVKELKKNYKDFSLDVTLDIPDGRITGLVGKNGAGKSTVIKAILGLVKPDGGSVTVFGKAASALTPEDKQQIGVALSDSGFSSYLTPGDCAKILVRMYDCFDRQAFTDACRKYGLTEDKQIRKFSTGMKARLRGICRFMMSVMSKAAGKTLENKKERTPDEDDMLELMLHGGNRVSEEALSPVLNWYKSEP